MPLADTPHRTNIATFKFQLEDSNTRDILPLGLQLLQRIFHLTDRQKPHI